MFINSVSFSRGAHAFIGHEATRAAVSLDLIGRFRSFKR